ncbi:MAG: uroporphyrinogen decarboxylase family protein [Ignisphaera sp.]
MPIDLGGSGVTGIHVNVYHGVRRLMGLSEKPIRVADYSQMLAEVEKEVLERLNIDVVRIDRVLEPCHPDVNRMGWRIWRNPQGIHIEFPEHLEIVEEAGYYKAYLRGLYSGRMPKDGYYFWWGIHADIKPPLADAKTIEDIKDFNWDQYKFTDEEIENLRKKAEWLYRNTEYAIVLPGVTKIGGLHDAGGQSLRGWDRWLSDLRIRKPLAEAVLDYIMELYRYNIKRILNALGEYVNVAIVAYDDLGTEEGPQISVQTFREFYKNRYEEIISYVKKYSKAFTRIHSCGSIHPFIKEFVDIGLDAIDPVQISARGMDPVVLKRDFGEQIVFWGGGVDTQHILPFAKEEEVIEHVKKLIEIFKPGGGYIYAPVHNIQPNTPPQNIIAIYTTAYKYGKYIVKT